MATSKRTTSDGLPIFDSVSATDDGLPVFKKKVSSDVGITEPSLSSQDYWNAGKQPNIAEAVGNINYQPEIANKNLGIDLGQKPVDTKAIKEQEKKTAKQAAINTTDFYFKNNPPLFENIKKNDISLKNIPTEEKDQYSLKNLKNTTAYQRKLGELMNAYDSGELQVYKAPTGEDRLARKMGGWDNFANGFKEAWNAKEEASKVLNMSADDFIKHTNAELKKDDEYLPVKPNPESTSYALGSAAPMLLKGVTGAAVGSTLAAAAPATGGLSLEGLPLLTAYIATVPEMVDVQRANTLVQGYKRAKQENPNISDKEAYSMATKYANAAGMQALAQGTAYNFIGMGLPANTGQGLWKAAGQFLKNQPTSLLAAGAVGKGGEYFKDMLAKNAGFNISDDETQSNSDKAMYDAMTMQLAFNVGFGLLGGAKYLKPQSYEVLSKADPQVLQKLNEEAIQQGFITKEQSDKTMSEINDYSKLRQTLPKDIPEDKAAAVTGILLKNENLEAEKKTTSSILHDDIDAEIKANEVKAKQILSSNQPLKHETDNLTGERGQDIGGRPSAIEKEQTQKEIEEPNSETTIGSTTVNESEGKPTDEGGKEQKNISQTLEAQKADIEKRRQEELSTFNTDKIKEKLFEKYPQYFNKDMNEEQIISRAQGVEDALFKKNIFDEEDKPLIKLLGSSRETIKERAAKANAKYDAELAELEKQTPIEEQQQETNISSPINKEQDVNTIKQSIFDRLDNDIVKGLREMESHGLIKIRC